MRNLKNLLAVIAFSLLVLSLPTIASAQWGTNDQNRNNRGNNNGNSTRTRDRDDDKDRDNDQNRANRSNRNSNGGNGGYGNGNYNGGYNANDLRYAVQRLNNSSKDFQKRLNSDMKQDRYNNGNYQNQINQATKDFRNAAGKLNSKIGNAQDLSRSSYEAQNLIQSGQQLNSMISRMRLNNGTQSDWDQIVRDLSAVSNAYRYNSRNGGYGNGNTRGNSNQSGSWRDRVPFPLPF